MQSRIARVTSVFLAGVAMVGAGGAVLDRVPWLGWPLVVAGAVAMAGVMVWLLIAISAEALMRTLATRIAERLDVDAITNSVRDEARELTAGVREEVREDLAAGRVADASLINAIAASVMTTLEERNALRTPELDEPKQRRRLAAHDTIAFLEDQVRSMRDKIGGTFTPAWNGSWPTDRTVLGTHPIYDAAVRATDRALRAISLVAPDRSNSSEQMKEARAEVQVAEAVTLLETAIGEDR